MQNNNKLWIEINFLWRMRTADIWMKVRKMATKILNVWLYLEIESLNNNNLSTDFWMIWPSVSKHSFWLCSNRILLFVCFTSPSILYGTLSSDVSRTQRTHDSYGIFIICNAMFETKYQLCGWLCYATTEWKLMMCSCSHQSITFNAFYYMFCIPSKRHTPHHRIFCNGKWIERWRADIKW